MSIKQVVKHYWRYVLIGIVTGIIIYYLKQKGIF